MLSSAYTVTDLGSDTDKLSTMALNNQGEVVAGADGDAFVFSGGHSTPLASPTPKLNTPRPLAISSTGVIVGSIVGPRTGVYQSAGATGGLLFTTGGTGGATVRIHLSDGFIYDGQTMQDIGPTWATSINSSGQVAGLVIKNSYFNPLAISGGAPVTGFVQGAFIFTGGKRRALKLPPHLDRQSISSIAIDDAGDVILSGKSVYMYPHGSRKPVQLSPLGFNSVATGSAGAVAGVVTSTGNVQHAWLVQGGQTTDLGTFDPGAPPLSTMIGLTVKGINSAGDVVGNAVVTSDPLTVGSSFEHAVLFHSGSWTDLNTLAPPAETGWTLQSAQAINDSGQIAAIGTSDGGTTLHYLLLTPVG